MSFADLVADGYAAEGVPLAPFTTYKLGGPAAYFVEAHDGDDLERIGATLATDPHSLLILGRGSNLVISDAGFNGVVVRLTGDFLAVTIDGDRVTAGGAVPLPRVARESVKASRGGLEFLVGIPGSVGGAVRMNAGCHGSETREWLESAHLYDLRGQRWSTQGPEDLDMSYRHSSIDRLTVVTTARFHTVARDRPEGEALLREITAWRRDHQPGGTFNAGSVFKNPPEVAAGKLIDELGLKGFRRGGASVSRKHANFFVAEQGAPAQDIFDLVWAVRRRVGEETGIWLEPEVGFAGSFRRSLDQDLP